MMRSLKTRRNKGRPGRRNMGDRFRSNGHRSEMKITEHTKPRGLASHVYEKYCSLARDAMSAGDKVSAENFLQHADHFARIIGEFQEDSSNSKNKPSDKSINGNGENLAPEQTNGESANPAPDGVLVEGEQDDKADEPIN